MINDTDSERLRHEQPRCQSARAVGSGVPDLSGSGVIVVGWLRGLCSTAGARLGDRRWQARLGQHHRLVREQLARLRGGRSTPPGTGSSPPSTARPAIRCALGIRGGVHALGLSVRAGLHTGEVESSWQRRSAGSPLYRYSQVSHPPW